MIKAPGKVIRSTIDHGTGRAPMRNAEIASVLDEVAGLLEDQGANPFRVRAYRNGAQTIRSMTAPVHRIVAAEGVGGLSLLPSIGHSLAHSIDQLVRSGHLSLLDRLRGENVAEKAFATVADIGPRLARRIHEALGIETLAELEAAADDGRLASVRGMGAKRLRAVRESLAGRRRVRGTAKAVAAVSAAGESAEPPIAELLDIDREYRQLAAQGRLPRIAPRSFNPTHAAWLPVLHTHRDERHYTALFSNTARAHEFGATHDWVVIYRDDQHDGARWTVITANFGALRGKRIIRGWESQCAEHYARENDTTADPTNQNPSMRRREQQRLLPL